MTQFDELGKPQRQVEYPQSKHIYCQALTTTLALALAFKWFFPMKTKNHLSRKSLFPDKQFGTQQKKCSSFAIPTKKFLNVFCLTKAIWKNETHFGSPWKMRAIQLLKIFVSL